MREPAQRVADTVERLRRARDVWLATTSGDTPWLVPLWFLWRDGAILVATAEASRTVRNLTERPRVRLALPDTEDVVLIDGTAVARRVADLRPGEVDGYRSKYDSDPRQWADTAIEIRPDRILAWRGEPELTDPVIMRRGLWIS